MKSLFEKLFSLKIKNSNNPLEDFLTEIFGHCLSYNANFFKDFLELANIKFDQTLYTLKFQETFKPLEHQRH